jgi:anthranilate phosphoribosyltransferase
MSSTPSACFTEAFSALLSRAELSRELTASAFREILAGRWGDAEIAAVLTALRMKGETAAELSGAASALRDEMVRLPTGRNDVLDTCGTGGDGSGTFNVSTAAALVAAAAGAVVVKHGNRAASSRSGSADVLAELGVPVESGPEWSAACLARCGFAFCFAPTCHPVLARVGPIRRRLGVRTIFNLIGPLANPAGAAYQLLGVGKVDLLDPMAGAVARLGVTRAFLVCGRDGLDEVSLAEPTDVRRVHGKVVEPLVWYPDDFGLGRVLVNELKADGPASSAAMIRSVLAGDDTPAARVTLANAAAALLAAGLAASLGEGVDLARRAVAEGKAQRVLDQLVDRKGRDA